VDAAKLRAVSDHTVSLLFKGEQFELEQLKPVLNVKTFSCRTLCCNGAAKQVSAVIELCNIVSFAKLFGTSVSQKAEA